MSKSVVIALRGLISSPLDSCRWCFILILTPKKKKTEKKNNAGRMPVQTHEVKKQIMRENGRRKKIGRFYSKGTQHEKQKFFGKQVKCKDEVVSRWWKQRGKLRGVKPMDIYSIKVLAPKSPREETFLQPKTPHIQKNHLDKDRKKQNTISILNCPTRRLWSPNKMWSPSRTTMSRPEMKRCHLLVEAPTRPSKYGDLACNFKV